MNADVRPGRPSRATDALAGAIAGGAGLALAELIAGLLPGAPSVVTEVGALLISLQPSGAKQLVVDLFGSADKLVLTLAVTVVALLITAGLGILARRRRGFAQLGFLGFGLLGIYASLRDPLVDPIPALLSAAVSILAAIWTLDWLLGRATVRRAAEMPDWNRRRFLGSALTAGGVAVVAGTLGRVLFERQQAAVAAVPPLPAATPAPSPPAGAMLDVPGITPLVVSNDRFYRIDTQLLTPHLDAANWELSVTGLVERELRLSYRDLLDLPQFEQYVTIACVSNEVGGNLVGNALWSGVRLREVLDRAGVQTGATQVVGRAFDGWTAGFPTDWLDPPAREAMIAVGMNGEPLPPQHGFPARLIVPGLFGYVSATKWLTEIELTTLEAFDAYWVRLGWAKEGPILTQSRIDTPRDGSHVTAGTVAVAGVAWAPDRGVSRVEVQVDEGPWNPAELSRPISNATWLQWLYRWTAQTGPHTLRVRATDGNGAVQAAERTTPPPDGARGYHQIGVTVDG